MGRPCEWSTCSGMNPSIFVLISKPLDSLLHYYGKVTNLIAQSEKIKSPSVEYMTSLFSRLNNLKAQIEDWKKNLPSYYEYILVPVFPGTFEYSEALEFYPYTERHDYVTGKTALLYVLIPGFIGHTMNMYRAAILRIDRHLLGHMFPTSGPSKLEISYTFFHLHR